jgi:D-alanyl-D-alanine carboxypeptidase
LTPWLAAALAYIPQWLTFQMRQAELPGLSLAITHQGKPVLVQAFGHADLGSGEALTPQHRFRVASHSKTFTATAVMKLREQGRLQLDDPIGRHVGGLHPQVATATLAQLLSHSAGLVRDGRDSGQWMERRPFLSEAELRADLADGPTIEGNTRFKYSNHGFGLLGLAIESVTGERYADWVAREVVTASGLQDTLPDAPDGDAPLPRLASGHSGRWPLGRRLAIPATMNTQALTAATGFVSTAADLARFFGSLSPQARKSVLSVASRKEMTRPHWREPHASVERWYGLGTMSGTLGAWAWFGHTGGFPGTLTRTACVPAQGLVISALTNASDELAGAWVDGILRILLACAQHGAPTRASAPWTGRWWSLWGALDLLPVADKVLVANPALANPLQDAAELGELTRGRDGTRRGRIVLANGYAAHGEPVALSVGARGKGKALQLAGGRLLPETAIARELQSRYG